MMTRRYFHSLLVAHAACCLTFVSGCGGSRPEGDLPPEKPATEEELKKADEEMKEAMKNMGRPK